jgi:hypothetical protein
MMSLRGFTEDIDWSRSCKKSALFANSIGAAMTNAVPRDHKPDQSFRQRGAGGGPQYLARRAVPLFQDVKEPYFLVRCDGGRAIAAAFVGFKR